MMKHLKTFETFIYENEVNETLHEASHAGRAWSGKIENIDKLLSWMYDKGILNKTEQAEKDRTFRQYYRYYNDGDIPQGLRGMKDEAIELHIEQKVEEFIKKILAKYTGKYDRRDFRIDTLLGDLNTLENIVAGYAAEDGVRGEPDPYGLLNYWGKKINTGNSEFEKMLGDLRPLYDDARKAADDIVEQEVADGIYKDEKSYNIPSKTTGLSYVRMRLQDAKVWTPDAEKKYMKMKDVMMKMHEILRNVIEATQQLKAEVGV
jgi:hypothetical protein